MKGWNFLLSLVSDFSSLIKELSDSGISVKNAVNRISSAGSRSKSISAMARQNICQFPLLTSTSISVDAYNKVSNILENLYTNYLRMTIMNSNEIIELKTGDNKSKLIERIHQNDKDLEGNVVLTGENIMSLMGTISNALEESTNLKYNLLGTNGVFSDRKFSEEDINKACKEMLKPYSENFSRYNIDNYDEIINESNNDAVLTFNPGSFALYNLRKAEELVAKNPEAKNSNQYKEYIEKAEASLKLWKKMKKIDSFVTISRKNVSIDLNKIVKEDSSNSTNSNNSQKNYDVESLFLDTYDPDEYKDIDPDLANKIKTYNNYVNQINEYLNKNKDALEDEDNNSSNKNLNYLTSIDKVDSQILDLENQISNYEKEISELRKEITVNKEKIESITSEIRSIENEISKIDNEIIDYDSKRNSLSSKKTKTAIEYNKRITELNDRLKVLRSNRDKLNDELHSIKPVTECNKLIEIKEKAISKLKNKITNLQNFSKGKKANYNLDKNIINTGPYHNQLNELVRKALSLKAAIDSRISTLNTNKKDKQTKDRDKAKEEAEICNAYFNTVKSTEIIDSKIKKHNNLTPTMLRMDINYLTPGGILNQTSLVVGVKCITHIIDFEELAYFLPEAIKRKTPLFKFIQWTTGEIKFMRDLVMDLDNVKMQVNSDKKSIKWWRHLQARRKSNSISKLITGKDAFLPNATIMLSTEDVEFMKIKDNIDIYKDTSVANRIMDTYFLMHLVIIDEANNEMLLYNRDTKSWDRQNIDTAHSDNDSMSMVFNNFANN